MDEPDKRAERAALFAEKKAANARRKKRREKAKRALAYYAGLLRPSPEHARYDLHALLVHHERGARTNVLRADACEQAGDMEGVATYLRHTREHLALAEAVRRAMPPAPPTPTGDVSEQMSE